MSEGGSMVAVIDGVADVPVIWWVDLGPRPNGVSRLCGAWVLDDAHRVQKLQTLTALRMAVATAAGRSLLDEHRVAIDRMVDLGATSAAVLAVRDQLQHAYEHAVASRKNGRSLIAPDWPTLPARLDVETADGSAGDFRAGRALAVARWLNQLCVVWDTIEEQRLARAYLRSLGGPTARALPVVIETARPALSA
jgi:hypothetical protein